MATGSVNGPRAMLAAAPSIEPQAKLASAPAIELQAMLTIVATVKAARCVESQTRCYAGAQEEGRAEDRVGRRVGGPGRRLR